MSSTVLSADVVRLIFDQLESILRPIGEGDFETDHNRSESQLYVVAVTERNVTLAHLARVSRRWSSFALSALYSNLHVIWCRTTVVIILQTLQNNSDLAARVSNLVVTFPTLFTCTIRYRSRLRAEQGEAIRLSMLMKAQDNYELDPIMLAGPLARDFASTVAAVVDRKVAHYIADQKWDVVERDEARIWIRQPHFSVYSFYRLIAYLPNLHRLDICGISANLNSDLHVEVQARKAFCRLAEFKARRCQDLWRGALIRMMPNIHNLDIRRPLDRDLLYGFPYNTLSEVAFGITAMTGHSGSFVDARSLTNVATSLRSLTIADTGDSESCYGSSTSFEPMPNLKYLRFGCEKRTLRDFDLTALLGNAPSLEHLRLDCRTAQNTALRNAISQKLDVLEIELPKEGVNEFVDRIGEMFTGRGDRMSTILRLRLYPDSTTAPA